MAKTTLILFLMLLILPACSGNSKADDLPAPTAPTSSATNAVVSTSVATQQPLPTALPTPEFILEQGILVSEVFVADDGGAFIELYNAGAEAVDLDGYTLIYQENDDADRQTIFTWDAPAYILAHGYYLLARKGFPVERLPDATFDALPGTESGGLLLLDGGTPLPESRFTWGDAPKELIVNKAAVPMENGSSLQRLPGGIQGNGRDSGDHSSDIVLSAKPQPRNSGDPVLPTIEAALSVELELPFEVAAGEEFSYLVRIRNLSGRDLSDVQVSIPLGDGIVALSLPPGGVHENGRLTWTIADLFKDANITAPIFVKAPYSQETYTLAGGSVSAETLPVAIARIVSLNVGGGKVPIEAADQLLGQTITVEGVATMHSDGFWTQHGGLQFYIQDETGGIKVHLPSEAGRISVAIGDTLRVTGLVRQQRGHLEIVPDAVARDINKSRRAEPLPPLLLALEQGEKDETLSGQLVEISGTATRVKAFPHWYEIDLLADDGAVYFVRVDKLTGIQIDNVVAGKRYRVVGISEQIEADNLILPRQQDDLVVLEAPGIYLDYVTPATIELNTQSVQTITLVNDTTEQLHSLIVAANIPRLPNDIWVGDVVAASGNGQVAGDGKIYWGLGDLPANGGSAVLTYTVDYMRGDGPALADVSVSAESLDQAITMQNQIFIGVNIPIASIQGRGGSSPFVNQQVTTEGKVSAVFPELNAFSIQSVLPDEDEMTSDGLLVQMSGEGELPLYGENVVVSGLLREVRGQTTLLLDDFGRIESRGFGGTVDFFTPVPLDPPQDPSEAAAYYEPLEGMVVAIDESAVVVAPTNSDGEATFVLRRWGDDSLTSTSEYGHLIVVDDASPQRHFDASTIELVYRRGDRVRQLVGVLAYTNDTFKILPFAPYEYESGLFRASRQLPEVTAEGQFSVATFNLNDLFDWFPPQPDDLPQLSREQVAARLEKIAAAIVAMNGPTLIALQEVESVLLLEELIGLDSLAPFEYSVLMLEGDDPRGINNAFLLREQVLAEGSLRHFIEPTGLTQRHPLVLELELDAKRLFVINVQLVSAESHESTSAASRLLQAQWLTDIVAQLQAEDADASIIMLGDFASPPGDAIFDSLEAVGLQDVFDTAEAEKLIPYTIIEEGVAVAVDYVLVSADIVDRIVAVDNLHINADYPIIDYDDPSAARSSDHDPLVVTIE